MVATHLALVAAMQFQGLDTTVTAQLAAGDTAAAIAALRVMVVDRPTAGVRCALAKLLTAQATNRREDWQVRLEAEELFEASLAEDLDPACLLGFAELKDRQNIRIDAGRVARRALGMLEERPERSTPALLADIAYRRAAPIAAWVRNFDHLAAAPDVPVSTPSCQNNGYFCESIAHPFLFFERLARAERLDDLVRDDRAVLEALLDTALTQMPAHPGALSLALREAVVADDWARFAGLARRAHAAQPGEPTPVLALLTAAAQQRDFGEARVQFDTLLTRLSPTALAQYEGLALIADSSVRDRLHGEQQVVYADAVWGLSDPLYLTAENERRLSHYARVFLADVLFGDPGANLAGRNTEQGRLLIRYGMPRYWFQIKADRSRELTPAQREQMDQIVGCASTPLADWEECVISVVSMGQRMDAGGRWSFWFYDSNLAPFIFERSLGYRVARHKQFTRSEALDSAVYRELPSSFEPPFAPGDVTALVTRFPRPHRPVLEVHARFAWPAGSGDSARIGIFVHDRQTGRVVQQLAAAVQDNDTSTSLAGTVPVPWGGLRIAVEGFAPATNTAVQLRRPVDIAEPASGGLTVSDLLLGDSAFAPEIPSGRSAVRFWARSDSVYRPEAPVALYWETYGLSRLTEDSLESDAAVRFRVRLQVLDAGGRPVLTELWRGARQLLGVRRPDETTVEWEVRRRTPGNVVPELLVLTAPRDEGRYRLALEITDMIDGRSARAERVITVSRAAAASVRN